MNFAVAYLAHRFFYRIGDFFHHWYVGASKNFVHGLISFLESLDRTFAVRVTFKYFFQPLYGDYTILGRLLGFIFRPARILAGLAVYAVVVVIFLLIYLAWLITPILILFYVGKNI